MFACTSLATVMTGQSASKDAPERAYAPAIHVCLDARQQEVDARDRCGRDDSESLTL